MLLLASPGAAMATIYLMDQKWVSSSTNPGEYGDHAVVWREGWGNHPLAQFLIKIPQPIEGEPAILGSYYTVMRPNAAMPTTITPDMWPNCYNAPVNAASEWKLPIDLIAEDANPGPYFGPTTMVPGAVRTYEGPYAVRFRFYAKDEPKAAGAAFGFGLDVTPPAQVTGLRGLPGYGDAAVNGWLKQSRIHLLWTDKVYDTLAGTGYFEAFLDGKPYYKPGDADDKTKTTYRVYDLKEHFPGFGMTIGTRREMTIEDLPAGKHILQVRAVDRASNAGALSAPINISVDPDIPTISIIWPKVNGQTIGVKPTVQATVKDLGGVKAVRFYVDGVLKATDLKSPYEASLDLSPLRQGSTHKLKVVAWDMVGRTNYAEKSFVLDKVAPTVSSVSAGPTPFYPRKREGYKDNFVVKFKASEPATAKLTIRDSSGKVWRTITKSVPRGATSIAWNGRSNAKTMKQGTFKWSLRLTDVAGNRSSAKTGTTSIKYYKTIVSGSSVRIVEF